MSSHNEISTALRNAKANSGVALVPFFTAGYPTKETFTKDLIEISTIGDVVEVGIPFSDPMSDGMTIQRSSHIALKNGVSLSWVFDQIESVKKKIQAPLVFMSYLNPLLAFNFEKLAKRAKEVGVSGFIVPDLPLEESDDLRKALENKDLGLIQLVSPTTPKSRIIRLCEVSKGFVYAVTMTGITGSEKGINENLSLYLNEIKKVSNLPVCAGFGVRSASDVNSIAKYADGAIVGSALVETMEKKQDIIKFLNKLR